MRRHLVVAAIALVAAGPLSAQSDSPSTWPVGSRVRVSTQTTRKIVGKLSEVRGDTLVIRTGVSFQPGRQQARVALTFAFPRRGAR